VAFHLTVGLQRDKRLAFRQNPPSDVRLFPFSSSIRANFAVVGPNDLVALLQFVITKHLSWVHDVPSARITVRQILCNVVSASGAMQPDILSCRISHELSAELSTKMFNRLQSLAPTLAHVRDVAKDHATAAFVAQMSSLLSAYGVQSLPSAADAVQRKMSRFVPHIAARRVAAFSSASVRPESLSVNTTC
jgi:hypothetical protein